MSDESDAPAPAEATAVTFRWDLDKTYLRTEFESLRKIVKIPFEAGTDKVHLPGVPELIRALRRHAADAGKTPYVFFLSASPPQIGGAIREKLELDGVEFDGITFKDQLRHLVRGRWGTLREQVGYKLGELLAARAAGPAASTEVLFGDDWESDPLIYSLYADILRGSIDADLLRRVLVAVDVGKGPVQKILALEGVLRGTAPDTVGRIFINLEKRTPPSRFRSYGSRVVPTFNTLQASAALLQSGFLDLDGVMEVARALLDAAGGEGYRLRNSIDDLTRRGHLRLETRDRLVRRLSREKLAPLSKGEQALRARLRAALARFRRGKRQSGVGGADWESLVQQFEEG